MVEHTRSAPAGSGRGPRPAPGPAGGTDAVAAALAGAVATLRSARQVGDPVQRYRTAHLAAVRGAVAVLGGLARPTDGPGAQRSVWSLLADRLPELTEWAWFLARAAPATLVAVSAPGAGEAARVGSRDADDLLRQVGQFLDLLAQVAARHAARPAGGGGDGPRGAARTA